MLGDTLLVPHNCIIVIQIYDTASFEHLNFAIQIQDEAASSSKAKTVSYSCIRGILQRSINISQEITGVEIREEEAPKVDRSQYSGIGNFMYHRGIRIPSINI